MRRVAFCLVATVLLPVFLISCKEQGKEPPRPQASPVEKESSRGPVRVKVMADKDRITIAEHLTLTVEAESPEDFKVTLPAFGDKLGEFGILEYHEEPPQLRDRGRVVVRKIYELEPFLSGEYKLQPMTVAFQRGGEDVQRMETEELTVTVESLLGEDRSKLELHPAFGPVDLPRVLPLLWILGGALVLMAMGLGWILWQRRRRHGGVVDVRPVPAHEIAFGQLEDLLRAGFVERGELKLFFAGISDIMRTYIENRFGLHAPRRTTEEFLTALSQDGAEFFTPEHRGLLDDFLKRCDLVKFANHLPLPQEVGSAVEACRAFVEATKEEAVPGYGTGGTA